MDKADATHVKQALQQIAKQLQIQNEYLKRIADRLDKEGGGNRGPVDPATQDHDAEVPF